MQLITSTTPVEYLGFITVTGSGNVAELTPTSTILGYNQTHVQDWTNPPALLTGVPYTISASGGNSLAFLFDDGSATGAIRDIQPYFVSTVSYFGCTSSTINTISNDTNQTLQLSYCSIVQGLNTDLCPGLPAAAYTSSGDCVNGFPYAYCPVGQFCSGKCKSTCQDTGFECVYAPRSIDVSVSPSTTQGSVGAVKVPLLTFQCQSNPNTPPPVTTTTNTGLSVGWIVAIVIGAIVLILILFLIYRSIIKDKGAEKGEVVGDASDVNFPGESPPSTARI
jgi:hypothetical protein